MANEAFLRMSGIGKEFPGVRALEGVSFECHRGSVHALVGENGAGKSTLIKILCGVYQPSCGEIIIDGNTVKVPHPDKAAKLGISVIHQELNLVPAFTVAQNLFLGHEPVAAMGAIDARAVRQKAKELLARVGVDVDPDTRVRELSLAQKQMVEIAKALSHESKIIVMDEPTAALNGNEVRKLMELIKSLAASNHGVIFISHRLEEVFEVCDTVTVLRDGQVVDTKPAKDLTMDDVVRMMTGKAITGTRVDGQNPAQPRKLLEVQGLTGKKGFRDVSLTLHAGEVVGLIGLEGQGQREFLRSLFGIVKTTAGQILVDGRPVRIRSASDAIRAGLAFVPEERKVEGLCLVRDLLENMALPTLRQRHRFGFIKFAEERKMVEGLIDTLKVHPPSASHKANNLSGGNQQKVVIAKWIAAKPKVFLFAEPTRGVDVGAKEEIYQLMRRVTDAGAGVLMVSTDMGELLRVCDRILVMFEGRIVKEFAGTEATRESMMAAQWGLA
ncbi:MAG: sugar ABC transporter ATP-binding protein [Chitinophagales bacterium]